MGASLTVQSSKKFRGKGTGGHIVASDASNWKNRIKSIQSNTLKNMMSVLHSNSGPPPMPQPQIVDGNKAQVGSRFAQSLIPVSQYGPYMYGRKLPNQGKLRS